MDSNAALTNLRRLSSSILSRQNLSKEALGFADGFQLLDQCRSETGRPMPLFTGMLMIRAHAIETGPEEDPETLDLVYGFQGLIEHLEAQGMIPDAW